MMKKQTKYLQRTIRKTICGKTVIKNNLVIDINVATCEKCKGQHIVKNKT